MVPNTGSLRGGMAASAAAGIIAGRAEEVLEVLATVSDEQKHQIKEYLETTEIEVTETGRNLTFELTVTVSAGTSTASVQISHYHTNIVLVTKDGEIVYSNQDCDEISTQNLTDRTFMNVRDILHFAESVNLSEVEDLLQQQIDYNMAIAEEGGMTGEWGGPISAKYC